MKCWLGCLKRILGTGEPVEDKRMLKQAGKWVEIRVIWHDSKKKCCSDCLWVRTARKRDSHPMRTKSLKHVCLKTMYLLVDSHFCCWIWVRCGAELQFCCTTVDTHHGHWAKEQQGKGRAIHSGDCGYLHGITRALGDKASNVLKSLIFSLVNFGGFFGFSVQFFCDGKSQVENEQGSGTNVSQVHTWQYALYSRKIKCHQHWKFGPG